MGTCWELLLLQHAAQQTSVASYFLTACCSRLSTPQMLLVALGCAVFTGIRGGLFTVRGPHCLGARLQSWAALQLLWGTCLTALVPTPCAHGPPPFFLTGGHDAAQRAHPAAALPLAHAAGGGVSHQGAPGCVAVSPANTTRLLLPRALLHCSGIP